MAAASQRPSRSGPARRGPDVREWLSASRLSGFTVIMLGLVVLAAFVLVPTVGTYMSQRQQIAVLEHSVAATKSDIAALERQQEQWRDPAYVATQARERLYFVKPGETVYLVDDDLPASAVPRQDAPVSTHVQVTHTDWMSQLVRSVTTAGMARTAVPGATG